MTTLAHFIADVTFLEIAGALVLTGLIERALYLLPESAVGAGGWLLDTGAE